MQPKANSELSPGVRIADRYVVGRLLGRGGMGDVWTGRHLVTGARVALKVVRENSIPGAAERLQQEARVAANLQHRHLTRVFDLVRGSHGELVLVMELLRGETLASYLERRGPLGSAEAVGLLAPIVSTLAYVHEQGILHRDVSPSNIFLALEPDGTVIPKLLDFGISRVDKNVTWTVPGDVLGTPAYVPPERIRGARAFDTRSDVFSVAVVLYEIMTGESPFSADTPEACLAAVLEREVEPHPRIDPQLWFALRRALSKEPSDRPTARELECELLAVMGMANAPATVTLLDVVVDSIGADGPGESGIEQRESHDQSAERPSHIPTRALKATPARPAFGGTQRRRMARLVTATVLAVAGSLGGAAIVVSTLRSRGPDAIAVVPNAIASEPIAHTPAATEVSGQPMLSEPSTLPKAPSATIAAPVPDAPKPTQQQAPSAYRSHRPVNRDHVARTPGF